MSTARTAKQSLRKAVKHRLAQVSPQTLASDSAAVVSHVLASEHYQRARNVSCYLATPTGEVDTDGIIRHALAHGKSLFVPFCPVEDPTVMRMLRLRSLAHYESLSLNRWSIRELSPSEVNELPDAEDTSSTVLDLLLVPGLAFDEHKRRLGHGRGYYDRYITRTMDYPQRFNKPPPVTSEPPNRSPAGFLVDSESFDFPFARHLAKVALALEAQLIRPGEMIPFTETDRLPDYLFTPTRIIG